MSKESIVKSVRKHGAPQTWISQVIVEVDIWRADMPEEFDDLKELIRENDEVAKEIMDMHLDSALDEYDLNRNNIMDSDPVEHYLMPNKIEISQIFDIS